MISRTAAAWLIGLAVVVAVSPSLAWAEFGVMNLRVGRDATAEPSSSTFPPGTPSVFARFDYQDAADHDVRTSVMVHGGVVGYSTGGRLTGTGSESVEVTGSAVFRSVSAETVQAAQTARSNAEKAATQSFGLAEYLTQVEAGLNRVDSALVVIRGIDSPAVDQDLVETMTDASTTTRNLLERAAGASDDPQRRELAAAMDEPLGELVVASMALSTGASEASGVPLPVSGGVWQYVVSVSVDGSPALTTEFEVVGAAIFIPSISK